MAPFARRSLCREKVPGSVLRLYDVEMGAGTYDFHLVNSAGFFSADAGEQLLDIAWISNYNYADGSR
jgi:hypothetical protein